MNVETTNAQIDDDFGMAIRENLSPGAVVMIAVYLQNLRASGRKADQTIREVEWFREALIEMVGFEEYNRLLEEVGL